MRQDSPEGAQTGDLAADAHGDAPQLAEATLLPEDSPLAPAVERMPERDELAHLLMGDGHHHDPTRDGEREAGGAGDVEQETEGTGERSDTPQSG